ncbi:MAG: glycosyltransferase family 2 protein [Bacteroidales bacterium]|nr:glycosyltransferase family 2 protein [Bacteroidales bacterium]
MMKTAICCIAKCENDYIREWVEYHLSLGITHIYIYDNNEVDGEFIEPVLTEYINKQVFILSCRGKKAYQSTAYSEFHCSYGKNYDWIAYIDVDEFITLAGNSGFASLNEYLHSIKGFDIIHINWMCYGDNDIEEHASNSVVGRFTKPLDFNKHIQYDFPENNHVKSIIRGRLNLEGIKIVPHSPPGNYKICDENGVARTENSYFKPYSFDKIYIRHYTTKTISEWLKKIARGRATVDSYPDLYPIEKFFKYNNETPGKRKIIDYYLFLDKVITNRTKTELEILKKDLAVATKELRKVTAELQNIRRSKPYRLGKAILTPISFLFK